MRLACYATPGSEDNAMTGTPGVYSIIQFVPAIARGEGVNVGVVVLCPGMGRVAARMSDSN